MNQEALPPPENIERRLASNALTLGVARTLLANTAEYIGHIETHNTPVVDLYAFDNAARDLLKRFYELATPQLPESLIDQRLFVDGDTTQPLVVLEAMDGMLASWQRGGIVTSQQEPLQEFTLWLIDAQRAIVSDVDDNSLRNRIERGIDMAEKRLL